MLLFGLLTFGIGHLTFTYWSCDFYQLVIRLLPIGLTTLPFDHTYLGMKRLSLII